MKKALAFLLCLCMVLGMIPSNFAFIAKAAVNDALTLDANNMATCPVCNSSVAWSPWSGTSGLGKIGDGSHRHYYLSGDVNFTANSSLFRVTDGSDMCLHLNGHKITYSGYAQVTGSGSIVNIMGTGNVTFTGTAPTTDGYWKFGFYITSSGKLNLYGGAYSLGETALENGVPMIQQGSGAVTVTGDATVSGLTNVAGGNFYLDQGASLENLQVGSGKLTVKQTWTGTARVGFADALVDNLVPENRGVAEGIYTGTLTGPSAVTFNATAEGRLQASGFNAGLVLDENNQALCPVCNETVTWTAKSDASKLGAFSDGTHKHYYLSEDLEVTADSYLLKVTGDTTMCLHLNGHSITYDGYAQVTGATLNVLGIGNVNFNGTSEQDDGWWKFGFYVTSSGKLNLLGGIYHVTETALESNCPMVYQKSGTTTVKDAEVYGVSDITGGTLTIDQTAILEDIQVNTAGKLSVKKTWTGKAKVSFADALVDGVVPTANGEAEGVFAGKLTYTGGRALNGTEEGTLVLDDPNKDLVLDENNQALCPKCNEVVKWTALTANKTFNGGGHHHYYLSDDLDVQTDTTNFIRTYNGAALCLHLNGHDITHGSRMFIQDGTTLSIMGHGNVTFTAIHTTNGLTDSRLGGIRAGGNVNLLGGTYNVAENAITEGWPYISKTAGTLNVTEATINGPSEIAGGTVTVTDGVFNDTFSLSGGNMIIDGAADFADLEVGTGAKLLVKKSWTGSAVVNFMAGLQDNKVPVANGEAEGDFPGTLTLSDGSELKGYADGTLNRVIILELDENNMAVCPVCGGDPVQWTEHSSGTRIGKINDGSHRHIYLSEDVTYENASSYLIQLLETSSLCLHLNNHNITTGSYSQIGTGSTLNIIGTGNVTFTGTGGGNYWKFLIYPSGTNATVNLHGGNYSATGRALEENLPLIYMLKGAVTLKDVTVNGLVSTAAGNLYLDDRVTVESIQMAAGKLTVNEGWTGTAEVTFPSALVDGAVPTANGASTGIFAGGLRMTDGTLLKGEGGKLMVNDYKALIVNEDNRGYCRLCDKMVSWNPLGEGDSVGTHNVESGSHTHYYFAEDNITAKNAEFMNLQDYNTVCLHLNNKSVKIPGRMRIHKTVLNIMGDGYVDFIATNGSYNDTLLYCWGSPYTPAAALNIYGGTFTSSAGKTVVTGYGTYSSVMAKVSLYGNTHIDGIMTLDQAHVYLHDDAVVESIEASNTGSVRVDESWNGVAKVSYLADMFEEYVNIFNGRSTGDFAGGLIMDGKRLIGESGRLRIVDAMELRLYEGNKGYCAVCHEVVDWTALEGSQAPGSYADGSHQHFYLSGTVDERASAEYLHLSESSDMCLHLNGYNITHGGPMVVENGSVLNILGDGNVTYIGDAAKGGIVSAGTVNLLDGSYYVLEDAEKANLPTLYITDGKTTVKDASIHNGSYLEKGTLVLDGSASLSSIHVETAGYLSVADTWTGTAAVEFDNSLTGAQAPAANISMGKATGTLTLPDGRRLENQDGSVIIDNVNAPENLSYKLSNESVKILSYTGDGAFLLPTQIAGKPVTEIAADAFAGFTGTLYIGAGDTFGKSYADGAGLTYTLIEAINGDTGFTTVQTALNDFETGAVQLLTDAASITVSKDTYLDLNGFDVGDVNVTGGTLYVMDSQTDDYTVEDAYGYGKITGTVTGSVKAVPAEAACAQYGYMQATEADGISFHCICMDIYGVTLRPDVAGVHYDCSFAADEVIAPMIESYGVALSIYGAPDETRKDWCASEYFDFQAGENNDGTLLQNIMTTENGDMANLANANTPVYGRAYIKTESGYVFGQTVCRDLQQQAELTDIAWEEISKELRENTRAMYETYESIMSDWEISNVDKYVDRIWFTEPAPDTGAGWEQYSLPLGNGYLGTSVFGGTESEVLSFADKTMYNPTSSADDGGDLDIPEDEDVMAGSSVGSNGFTNLCKLLIDFGHDFNQVTNYQRDLLLDTAEARVYYDYQGVTYNRTYFANYPDNVTVAKLDASQKGKLSFTLRPTPTYIRDHLFLKGDGLAKTGTVTASGDTAILSGTLAGYQINYEIQFKVIPTGGTMKANADGTITVTDADSAVILITAGTNYEMKPETMTAAKEDKLDPNSFPHDKVTAVMSAAAQKSYEELRQTHLEDYQSIYGRVEADLNSEPSTTVPTNKQMQAYRAGDHSAYVEELLFKHGRYLLIASSREGTLPANLQGMWQYYASAAWRGGYVYNINLQMNYWSCYATNLLDMFETNFEYFDAMWDTMETNADNYLTGVKSPYIAEKGTGANGIAIGASGTPYTSASVNASVSAHSGPATTAYTTSLLWDYYEFTGDKKALEEKIWPYIEGCAIFLDKTLLQYGDKWLVSHSASPENNMWFGNGAPDGPEITVGCMFDQMFTYETFCQVKKAAEILGYTAEDHPILNNIDEKIDKLDHVIVGKSGHVKEFREEEYYGEFGRYEHHGMAQLVGVYPATSITSETDAWQDAATVTATERGINYTGHQSSFKQLVWARLGNSDYAYLLAQDHITKYLRDNMWNTHTPFQIDGNFGYTAGVAEMLVQSHEGYISVLPALPEAWAATGSYSGLTARGGFEVGAAWKNGSATEISITSKNGGDVSVKYFNLSTAKVTDSQGNVVPFTADERDIITFATVAGETYTFTNLSEKVTVDAPSALTLTEGTNLSWKASPDAVSYNVYRAVNSQPTYELIAENVTGTTYAYVPTDLKAGDQLILRVTAVNADGVESTGVRVITWDFVVNEADAQAMQAANTAYASYTGDTTKHMLYAYSGRFVVLSDGVAVNVYDTEAAALSALYDDPVTTTDESESIITMQTTDGWYICKEGYTQHTYVAFGDSITYGIDGDYSSGEEGYNMEKPYPTLVAETLKIKTVVNQGKSGATLSYKEGRGHITQRILDYSGNADIISVMGGVNDFSAVQPLGDNTCRDTSTIYGSLHVIAQHLQKTYPNAFVFFMTPFPYRYLDNNTYTLADVAQAVKDVAAVYGIPVLDIYTEGQFDPATDAKDGIHPTQQHHIDYTAPLICEFIKAHYDPDQK